jgi:hypothetical protein
MTSSPTPCLRPLEQPPKKRQQRSAEPWLVRRIEYLANAGRDDEIKSEGLYERLAAGQAEARARKRITLL